MSAIRVMIVTYDSKPETHLTEFLGDRGYEVSMAPHTQDVLQMMIQTTPHVIILDLGEGAIAAETIRGLRAEGYKGKILLTGPSSCTTLWECWRAGIDQVVGAGIGDNGTIHPGQVEAAIRASLQKRDRAACVSTVGSTRSTEGAETPDLVSSPR